MELKNSKELKNLIKERSSGFAIAIWGVDKQKIKECIGILHASIDTMPELNAITLENDRVNYDEIVNACESLPFVSDKKLVHIKNPYFIKKQEKAEAEVSADDVSSVGAGANGKKGASSKDNVVEYLTNYLDNLPTDTILLISSDDESGPSGKLLAKIKGSGAILEYKSLKGAELNNHVKERFKELGKHISASDIVYFLAATLNNFEMVDKEIEKLCVYAAEEDTVTRKHIDDIVHKGMENNIFKMVDSISMKNADTAISILDTLLFQKEEPLKILSMIIRQYRILYLIQIMMLQMKSAEEMKTSLKTRKINLMDFMIANYMKQASKYDSNSLKRALELCYDADTNIKNSKLPVGMTMELLVVRLCS